VSELHNRSLNLSLTNKIHVLTTQLELHVAFIIDSFLCLFRIKRKTALIPANKNARKTQENKIRKKYTQKEFDGIKVHRTFCCFLKSLS